MNDTTRRFLSAITERVPAGGRIVELRLFPAIRQGGIESGVAVVAVEPPAVDPELTSSSVEESEEEGDVAPVAGDAAEVELPMAPTGDGESIGVAHAERVVPRVLEGIADDRSAAAALALVDTDIAPEDEEGTSGEVVEASATYIPSAATSDDDDVSVALDDEMSTIVIDAEREIRRAESRDVALRREVRAPADQPSAAGELEELEALDEPSFDPSDDAAVAAAQVVEEDASPDDSSSDVSSSDVSSSDASSSDAPQQDGRASDEDSPYADAPPPSESPRRELLADVSGDTGADPDVMRLDDILALPSPDNTDDAGEIVDAEESAPSPRAIQRYAILTASYRLTIKGPDRGKWDVELIHEADAPLATVERVARGVAKRSGDGSEPEHFSGESLRQALDAPAWIETT